MRSIKAAWKDRRRRRLLEKSGHRALECAGLWSLGARSGMWTFDPSRLHGKSVVYSFGIGDNVVFEHELAKRFGLAVIAFDPTPRALDYMRREQDYMRREQDYMRREQDYMRREQIGSSIEVVPVGLASFDGEQSFELPRRSKSVNFRPLQGVSSVALETARFPVKTLPSLMKEREHSWLDLLKMDIEGGEVAVLEALFEEGGPPADQVLIEFHHSPDGTGFQATDRLLRAFYEHDYELIHVSHRGLEVSLRKKA